MIKKILLFTSPLILFIEIALFNTIVDLMRQKSDIAVMMGTVLICGAIIWNYYLFKIIKNQFKE